MQADTEVPVGVEFIQEFGENKNKEGDTYLRATLEAKSSLSAMKWNGLGDLIGWLKVERVMLTACAWRACRRTRLFLSLPVNS